MGSTHVLDVIERLWTVADHPDVTTVHRYDGAQTGVAVVYRSGAKAFFAVGQGKPPATRPAGMPQDLGPWKVRTLHALKLTLDLLDLAQPDGMRWRTVAVDGVHLSPAGIEFAVGAEKVLVRVTAGGASGEDSKLEDFAGYVIPEAVKTCLQPANAQSAGSS